MSREALQKLQRLSKYEKRSNRYFVLDHKKGSENLSSRFEPKISLILFEAGLLFTLVAGPILQVEIEAQICKLDSASSILPVLLVANE